MSRTTTHVFEPLVFQLVFSAAIAPVLRIRPGDRVQTTTVDNIGCDAHNVRRSMPGNPLTGPFYIEGATRGDTLAIKLETIRPNRKSAHSGKRLVAKAVTSDYHKKASYQPDFSNTWRLDLHRRVATPTDLSPRLKDFVVPLQPFLGCMGVAPVTEEAFSARWLGPWGGNLDYNQLGEGSILYLPVYQTGALLSLGDGHAAQGSGELTGDAIETSMDVEFTVDVLPRNLEPATAGPRAESPQELMAFGIADSLMEALQKATTALAEWIARDYRLSANETALVLGTSIRYDIAEIVNPRLNVVARIDKATLAPLRASEAV